MIDGSERVIMRELREKDGVRMRESASERDEEATASFFCVYE